MNRAFLLTVLLALPVAAEGVVCKTVGGDGVVSYSDVEASDCPVGSRLLDYSRPSTIVPDAQSVDGSSTNREATFTGYRFIEIAYPADNEAVQSSDRRVVVIVKLEPDLQQYHFITIYVDKKAYRGRYGSSNIELTRVNPGTHKLRAKVTDTRGKTLIESDESTFSLLKPSRLKVKKVRPSIIEGTFSGPYVEGSKVTILFRETGNEYYGVVDRDGKWEVKVPEGEKGRFEAKAKEKTGTLEFKGSGEKPGNPKPHYNPEKPDYEPGDLKPHYNPEKPDYEPITGGGATTPGRTNPGFKPRYAP